jgi:hypothetical protein
MIRHDKCGPPVCDDRAEEANELLDQVALDLVAVENLG